MGYKYHVIQLVCTAIAIILAIVAIFIAGWWCALGIGICALVAYIAHKISS